MNSSLSNIVTPLLNWYHTYARMPPAAPSAVAAVIRVKSRVQSVRFMAFTSLL